MSEYPDMAGVADVKDFSAHMAGAELPWKLSYVSGFEGPTYWLFGPPGHSHELGTDDPRAAIRLALNINPGYYWDMPEL
jgi:hypothetical protein